MITTVARDYQTADISMYEKNTVLNILSNEELERELEKARHNAAYLAKIDRGIAQFDRKRRAVSEDRQERSEVLNAQNVV